jgi:nitrogen fixation-related uncharacterized protein
VSAALATPPRKKSRVGAVVLGVGTVVAALTFSYKIVEFVMTLDSPEAPGFAVVPVVTYFIVAAGYVLLFLWAYLNGQFADMERPKDTFLKREAELDRQAL